MALEEVGTAYCSMLSIFLQYLPAGLHPGDAHSASSVRLSDDEPLGPVSWRMTLSPFTRAGSELR